MPEQTDQRSMTKRIDDGVYKNTKPYVLQGKDRKAWEEYNFEEARLFQLFRKDALEDVGMSYHPKATEVFDFAWQHGHATGYHSVYDWLREVTKLVRD